MSDEAQIGVQPDWPASPPFEVDLDLIDDRLGSARRRRRYRKAALKFQDRVRAEQARIEARRTQSASDPL